MEKNGDTKVVAVIDIGSKAIRMDVAEIGKDKPVRILEKLIQPIKLGIDVFSTGKLSKESVNLACKVLADFKQVMNTYQVDYYRAVATSALREATNNESFLNRAFMTAGIDVDIISDAEELRLNYVSTLDTVKNYPEFKNKDSLIVDLGGGGTEVTVLRKGKITISRNYHLGTLRMFRDMKTRKSDRRAQQILSSRVRNTVNLVTRALPIKKFNFLIARGADARLIVRIKKWPVNERISSLTKEEFLMACEELMKFSDEELVNLYDLNYNEVESIYSACLIFKNFVDSFNFERVLIPLTSMRYGLVRDLVGFMFGLKKDNGFSKQIINSAIALGKKYQMDEAHAHHVAQLSLLLFDSLKSLHNLHETDRFYLEVAGILHDIGTFINETRHHEHSYYLVSNSELIGLSRLDIDIISNLVKYHRRATPTLKDGSFAALDRQSRIKVYKLAAILRVADALDRSHSQIIDNIKIKVTDDKLVITPVSPGVYEYEKLAMRQKSDLFDQVYGLEVELQ
jgi:exopolyphosphatase/guanosine-5'-triphosphate,3'-diphosphate pyrophosphatase